jgi:sugar phosphate isomerase/epimerase
MTIYVSTGGDKTRALDSVLRDYLDAGIANIELSGGAYTVDVDKILHDLRSSTNFELHNYFPPPLNPFVLNLGSLNQEVVHKSISHVEQAIKLASAVGGHYYSFHAGFLIDPSVSELGGVIKKGVINDRELSKKLFIERVNRLAVVAKEYGIQLMIENNVLSKKNLITFGESPLLMCDPVEINQVMAEIDKCVGLLMDVAHLKVSSQSLGFDLFDAFKDFGHRIVGYHLSDNDGFEDTNDPFTYSSWFWDHIKAWPTRYYSIEVYNQTPKSLNELVGIAERCLGYS